MRYRKKPVVVDAEQWFPGTEIDGVVANPLNDPMERDAHYIITLEGRMRVSPGDWIIRGIKGEVYPCKPDIFEATYTVWGGDSMSISEEDQEIIIQTVLDSVPPDKRFTRHGPYLDLSDSDVQHWHLDFTGGGHPYAMCGIELHHSKMDGMDAGQLVDYIKETFRSADAELRTLVDNAQTSQTRN